MAFVDSFWDSPSKQITKLAMQTKKKAINMFLLGYKKKKKKKSGYLPTYSSRAFSITPLHFLKLWEKSVHSQTDKTHSPLEKTTPKQRKDDQTMRQHFYSTKFLPFYIYLLIKAPKIPFVLKMFPCFKQ